MYMVRYKTWSGQESWTRLPLKTRGKGRKAQVVHAMTRIFGPVTVLEIAVARA